MSYPNWVYDLINAVREYEDVHCAGDDNCMDGVLHRVPKDQLVAAEAIKSYLADVEDKP